VVILGCLRLVWIRQGVSLMLRIDYRDKCMDVVDEGGMERVSNM
jgi:hypothetical protein